MSVLVLIPDIERLTESYHSNGGMVVIADSEARAVELASAAAVGPIEAAEWGARKVYELAGTVEERVYSFPDSGCC